MTGLEGLAMGRDLGNMEKAFYSTCSRKTSNVVPTAFSGLVNPPCRKILNPLGQVLQSHCSFRRELRVWGRVGPKEPGRTRKGSFPLWFPYSAPLTFKDGTALALSCMADYGAPVFPFLAVGGYQGK